MNKTINWQNHKSATYTLAFIYLMTLIFTREFLLFFRLSLTFTGVFIVGYSATILLLKDWEGFERSIVSLFIGLGICGLTMYLLSVIGLGAVSVTTLVVLTAIGLFLIWKYDDNGKKEISEQQ